MSRTVEILSSLKKTDKGKLKYETRWWTNDNLKDIIEECTSPPQLRILLNNNTKATENEKIEKEKEELRITIKPENKTRIVSSVTPQKSAVDTHIKDVEQDYHFKANTSIQERKEAFEQHTSMLLQQAENQLMQLYFNQESKARQLLTKVQEDEKVRNEELKKKQLKLKEHHKQHARFLDARLLEAHKKKKEEEEKQKEREAELRQKLLAMTKIQDQIKTLKHKLEENLKACQFLKYTTEGARTSGDLMQQILTKANLVVQEAANTEVTENRTATLLELESNAKNVYDFVQKQIEVANKKGEEERVEQERKKQEEERVKLARQRQQQQQSSSSTQLLINQTDTEVIYDRYKKLAQDLHQSCDSIMDDSNKKIRFELQKAVNIPVNAISRTSGSHLKDKLSRLTSLLQGQAVEVSGKKVSIGIHPAGYNFIKELLAKKVVSQGETQVASSLESAFPIAAVVSGVWAEFPDVGEAIMAHFILKCPYLVPYYLPKVQGQSDEDYYKALGYKYESSQVEQQDMFLKRMRGIIFLYCAILISPPPNQPNGSHFHPHGLEHGWMFLTRTINSEPRPDITATMIYNFLAVTGSAMLRAYGTQFKKMLQTVKDEFLPKLKKVTEGRAGGPVTRLVLFIDKCIQTGSIDPPDGTLSHSFWLS